MYYLKITAYADELLSELDNCRAGRSRSSLMQKNWIGKSTGVRFAFPLADEASIGRQAVGIHHPRRHHHGRHLRRRGRRTPAGHLHAANNPELAAFIEECKKGGVAEADMATMEKKGCRPACSSPTR
jgi:leucyl-tRNA synthetase